MIWNLAQGILTMVGNITAQFNNTDDIEKFTLSLDESVNFSISPVLLN